MSAIPGVGKIYSRLIEEAGQLCIGVVSFENPTCQDQSQRVLLIYQAHQLVRWRLPLGWELQVAITPRKAGADFREAVYLEVTDFADSCDTCVRNVTHAARCGRR